MTVSHNTETEADPPSSTEPRQAFPALKILEIATPPMRFGRPPYWGAPVVPASEDVYIPTWEWSSPHDFPEGEEMTVLAQNAGLLDAMSRVPIAHSQLRYTGSMPLPSPRMVVPGYYRVTVPRWAFSGTIVHPLGNGDRVQAEPDVWIAAPTLILLLDLEQDGHLGYFKILDSYTADVAADFKSWAARLHSLRHEFLDRLELAQSDEAHRLARSHLEAFQDGFSAALATMLTGDEESLIHRPDWAHAIHAQHRASLWRSAWRWTARGRPVAFMTDIEIGVFSADMPGALCGPKPLLRWDPLGREAGAFKGVRATVVMCEPQPRADILPMIDETEKAL